MGCVVSGWRDQAKRKKDSWTWTTMWLLQRGEGIRGLRGKRKNTVKLTDKTEENKIPHEYQIHIYISLSTHTKSFNKSKKK